MGGPGGKKGLQDIYKCRQPYVFVVHMYKQYKLIAHLHAYMLEGDENA